MEPARNLDDAVQLVCLLEDDVRRSCYQFVRHADQPATRVEVAEAVGISVRLAAFHLDKLVDARLLDADYRRPPGRGRGGGRPAKRYRTSGTAIELSLPPRRYDLIATVLAESTATGEDPRVVARRAGTDLVGHLHQRSPTRRVHAALAEVGFEPAARAGDTVQRNCPFRAAQRAAPRVVCELNHALVEGILDAAGDARNAVFSPDDSRCCIVIAAPHTTGPRRRARRGHEHTGG